MLDVVAWFRADHLSLVKLLRGEQLKRSGVVISNVHSARLSRSLVPYWANELFEQLTRSEHYLIERLARISAQEPALIDAAMTCYALGGVDALTTFVINVVPEATPMALP